jgi:hypothetical protein
MQTRMLKAPRNSWENIALPSHDVSMLTHYNYAASAMRGMAAPDPKARRAAEYGVRQCRDPAAAGRRFGFDRKQAGVAGRGLCLCARARSGRPGHHVSGYSAAPAAHCVAQPMQKLRWIERGRVTMEFSVAGVGIEVGIVARGESTRNRRPNGDRLWIRGRSSERSRLSSRVNPASPL